MIYEVKTGRRAIAITFDDGPNPVFTPQILDLFQKHNAKATFFTLGINLEQHPETAKLIVEGGHELGNHSYSHPYLTQIDLETQWTELERTAQLIEGIAGRKPTAFRPPFLDYNEHVGLLAEKFGCQTIGALNLETMDWGEPGVDLILQKSRDHIHNGSILLFHDGYGDRSQTVAALEVFVPEVRNQGYELVTISELLAIKGETIC
jgi:peptidoglycan/xylan/chitin deacetylase (PgdA/CDA1 family)